MAELILSDLRKTFGGGRAAVDGVSLTLRPGGFLALLGPSGCGKTTVLRMVAGFETPDEGAIRLGDRLLSSANAVVPPESRNMAMVFQSYALWPHMTVAGNVGYPLKVRGLSAGVVADKVGKALAAVHLEAFADRRPADLSGGQRQRVALARCLVTEPDVVLLDEPLANLDRHLRQEMEEAFRDFHARSGATMIYVTHDQAEAMALATDVAVMSEGRVLQMAPPAELYARPQGRLVGSLIGQGAILQVRDDGTSERGYDWPRLRACLGTAAGMPTVDVLVRPQDVEIGGDGLTATVESATFEGERHALRLILGDGQRLRAYSRLLAAAGDVLRVTIRSGWRL
ncbi:ATP-binding cassette domain-containing protein [Ciceribacter sp. L1K22]|uniref:ABC transporter ATP-binding protein n=1 Tax=Ciceribacter sp. L1K22 TaxID=2820275 RepID=UPI001ABEAEB6|nr:ABC transporter ATP-binding protein [Ciceribacter sp. L1K22]